MNKEPKNLSPNQQALLKIRELKQQLADARSAADEPIAIVSMACRFPRQCRTPELFWQSLIDQTDQVSDVPDDRWDLDAFHDDDPEVPGKMYARRGAFLADIDRMDPEFFGISPREATWVDPQQRLLMEVGWEALERAGWTAEQIGQHTGIFVGWMHNDYQNEASDSFLNLNPYIATGAAGSFLCGRIAYYLGLQGPSVAIDTACSSSLVALHLAIQSLQRRDCDRALVGGVNAIVSPTTNILTCKLKALSPTGQSRAFDAAADGYLRGEGCGVVTLRRLSDAQASRDPILGIVRGSAVGHNGFSSGLTAPNPKAQQNVIQQALQRAQIAAEDVGYLEAHGTGTELGDPIEIQAAAAALSGQRTQDNPLLVGSVKTNIGHLEAASGMAGLIKVLLAMQHDQIPGQLNFETPNPHIPWDQIPVRILTEPTAWPNRDRKIAGVSAFGMSGTNAHVVIEAPQSTPTSIRVDSDQESPSAARPPQLITVSAKNEIALTELCENLARQLTRQPSLKLVDVANTTQLGRSHFEYRAAVVANDRETAIDRLKLASRWSRNEFAFTGNRRRPPKVGWQFTGQGSQYRNMGRGLYDQYAIFKASIDDCDRLVHSWRNLSLLKILFEENQPIDDTYWTQPAIFAVQMGLVKLLTAWGLQPDVVMGHSVGQYAAACVAGIMSWQDGLKLICERGRLIGQLPSGGWMLAVFAAPDQVVPHVDAIPGVSLAAFNGTHVVISGAETGIQVATEKFASLKIRTKLLRTSHAFHSPLMDPVLSEFKTFAQTIEFESPQLPLVCNVTGQVLPVDRKLDAEYWSQHIRQPVKFSQGVTASRSAGCDLILELGPGSVLTNMAANDWTGDAGTLISCLQKKADDLWSLHQAIGQLYSQGCTVDFSAMLTDHPGRQVLLPTYPFQRRRFWGPDKPRAHHAEFHTAHPLLGGSVSLAGVENENRFESFIEPDSPAWLPDHQVMDQVVMPGAAFVEMALATGHRSVEQIKFEQPLRPTRRTRLQTVVRRNDDRQTIETYACPAKTDQWTRIFSSRVADQSTDRPAPIDRAAIEQRCPEIRQPEAFYQKMESLGLNYGANFQVIDLLRHGAADVLTRLQTTGDIRGYSIPPTLLDGALHSLAVGLLANDDGNLFLPVGIERVDCFQAIENETWCHAVWTQNDGRNRQADLTLFNDQGIVAVQITGLTVQQISVAALRQMSGGATKRLAYDFDWQRFRLPAASSGKKRWLVVQPPQPANDDNSVVAVVKTKLAALGHDCVRVTCDDNTAFESTDDTQFTLAAGQVENWSRLFNELSKDDQPYRPDGIAWFLQSDSPTSTRENCAGLLALCQTLAHTGQRSIECGLQLITTNAITLTENTGQSDWPPVQPQQSQFWGLGRVIGAEQPEYRCRIIDLAGNETEQPATTDAVVDILLTATTDSQLAIRDGQLYVPRLRALPTAKTNQPFSVGPDSCYLITGGLGKLGRQAAKWLAEQGAGQIVLVSRRQPDESTIQFLDSIGQSTPTAGLAADRPACDILVHCADMSSRTDVEQLFARFGNDLKPLAGIIHAAGLVDDGLIGDQTWRRFENVWNAKANGAKLLDELSRGWDLDFFILYSSAASVLGSPGQSNYATANAFLDGLAWQRRAAGLPATSINWGPWNEGMADDQRILKRLALQGITPLTVQHAHSAMESILAAGAVQATVMDVDWRRLRMGQSPALLERLAPSKQNMQRGDSELVLKLKKLTGNARRQLVVKTMQQLLQGVLSTPDLPETDRPLIELGLDSLMAVEFGTQLQQLLGDQFSVGPTLLFDHPTIDAISDFIVDLVADDGLAAETQTDSTADPIDRTGSRQTRDDVAIIGMSCRFPGARNTEEFWQNLVAGVDSVGPIPADRWDMDRFYSEQPQPGKMYTRDGGFLPDIADFDASFFNIADQEACWIDPQHRMLLENSYLALEDAGVCPQPLADANVGVFMGIMGQDYAFVPTMEDIDVIKAFQGAGLSHSAGVGRISYVFGFEGPSVAVDTASSSSLVALFQAVRSLQDGNCNLALAGGVNAILAPVNSLLMSKAGLLSPDGRCKSFSAAADGFGRGEGCGVVVLKRLADAQRDGDRVMAVVRGAAVVHNGFSSGITAPSSKAQSRVITEALNDAGVAPSEVQYLEAHGTGTEYGDPMELGAAAAIYGKGRNRQQPLLVGSVKANISHLEAAGGMSGLIKTVMSLQHGSIPPQAHFQQPSPHIPWQRLPIKMVTEQTAWPETQQRLAGITAIGLVGTNAHVVLSGPPATTDTHNDTDQSQQEEANEVSPPATDQPTGSHLLALSARNEPALRQLAQRYIDFFSDNPTVNLSDVCHTAGVGRRHYEHRLGVNASDVGQATVALQNFINGKTSPSWVSGVPQGNPKIGWFCGSLPDDDLAESIARLYRQEPVFHAWIEQLNDRLTAHCQSTQQAPIALLDWIVSLDDPALDVDVPAIELQLYVLQSGLVQLWLSRGIEPDAVLGIGVGQLTAACVAGGLCYLDAAELVVARQPILSAESFRSTEDFEKMADDFEAFADQFNYYPPNRSLVCSIDGQLVPIHRSLGGSYWRRHGLTAPQFERSLETFRQQDWDVLLPIGCQISPTTKTGLGSKQVITPRATRQLADIHLLQALGTLYAAGAAVDFSSIETSQQPRRIAIPGYPFQKKRYWITEVAKFLQDNNDTSVQGAST